MNKELLKMEIYTKATNIQAIVMNNLDSTTIDYVIAEIEYMKNKTIELKKEMEI